MDSEISFTRKEVAEILGCTVLTISNREKSGTYPQPSRNPTNNYRFYSLSDIMRLQKITLNGIVVGPILAKLWDRGYRDPAKCEAILKAARDSLKEQAYAGYVQ